MLEFNFDHTASDKIKSQSIYCSFSQFVCTVPEIKPFFELLKTVFNRIILTLPWTFSRT